MRSFTFLLPIGIFIVSILITVLYWLVLPEDLGISDGYIWQGKPQVASN